MIVLLCYLACVASKRGPVGWLERVPCEEFITEQWSTLELKQCIMRFTTRIYSTGVVLSSPQDDSVGAIRFDGNDNLKYLPEKIGDKFLNIVMFDANSCLIEAVSKENFKGLSKMMNLNLHDNRITKVESDTFEGLSSLILINLSEYFNNCSK